MARITACILVLANAFLLDASCFKGLDQRAIEDCVPVIVQGEIVKVELAKGTYRHGKHSRYLDLAHIRIDTVYKNALSDVKVVQKETLAVWMHSLNSTIPGGTTMNGKALSIRISTDLRYKVGSRAIWFPFLAADGKFYINRHPQQSIQVEKEAELRKSGIFRAEVGAGITRQEWTKQVTEFGRERKITRQLKPR